MRFKSVYVFLGVGFGILGAGCRTTGELKAKTVNPQFLRTGIDPRNGYISTRWIGLTRQGSVGCPAVGGWTGEPLLDQRSARDATIQELGLDRFCVYTPLPGPARPFIPPAGLTAARDRLSISSSADVVEGSLLTSKSNAVEAVLAQEFLSQSGYLSPSLPGPPNVQITFVDSQPDGDLPTRPPHGSQHGFAIAHLAQELVCAGPCAATVTAKRALNFDDPSQTTTPIRDDLAGSVGTISDLGRAIIAVVNGCSPGEHRILNLSIGWDGEAPLDGLTDLDARKVSELETPVQLVYQALQLAARKGVLVIAAAGNRRGGSLEDTNWPLLPAAWELRRPSWSPFGPPLIYAVGGVDWQGLPLPNSRTKGLPRRVAYGDHATAEVDGIPTAVYTGTSVSTAVVSAAAAVIWHLRPELTPAEVMRLIDRSGEPQEARADFYASWLWRAPRIREVSLCAAVKEACGADGKKCSTGIGSALECRPLDHQPPALSSLLTQAHKDLGAPFSPASSPSSVAPPCHPSTLLLTTGVDPVPQPICPTDEYSSISAQPWVLPQPGVDPCPNCTLVPTGPPTSTNYSRVASTPAPSVSPGSVAFARSWGAPSGPGSYQLAIALSQSWIAALQDVTLNVTAMLDIDCFANGEFQRTTYPVQIDSTTDLAWTAFGFGDGQSLKGCRAQLNFVVRDATGSILMSVQNPVAVDPYFSGVTGTAVNPVGSDRSPGIPSTKVVTTGEKERKKDTGMDKQF
jgi:hypothetical protein